MNAKDHNYFFGAYWGARSLTCHDAIMQAYDFQNLLMSTIPGLKDAFWVDEALTLHAIPKQFDAFADEVLAYALETDQAAALPSHHINNLHTTYVLPLGLTLELVLTGDSFDLSCALSIGTGEIDHLQNSVVLSFNNRALHAIHNSETEACKMLMHQLIPFWKPEMATITSEEIANLEFFKPGELKFGIINFFSAQADIVAGALAEDDVMSFQGGSMVLFANALAELHDTQWQKSACEKWKGIRPLSFTTIQQ